jgi:hypothetical protein
MKKRISRREVLKNSATLTGGIIATGVLSSLVGCAGGSGGGGGQTVPPLGYEPCPYYIYGGGLGYIYSKDPYGYSPCGSYLLDDEAEFFLEEEG